MQVEIKMKDQLTEAEMVEMSEFSHAVYPPDMPDDGASRVEWSSSTWSVLVRDDNNVLVSRMGLITRQAKCDDADVFIGGIGGVATHPNARRQGYAGFGLKHAAHTLRDQLKVDFSLLVCRDALIPYYGKFGWTLFEGDMLVDQSSGKTKFTFNKPMLIAGTKPVPQCDVIDLCGKPW